MADTDASSTSGSPLKKIPLEVLLRITYFLKTPDLGSFRLSCRAIEQALHTSFTNEFFTRKQFMMTQDSLQALIDISKSRFSPHLRKVHFGLERWPQGIHLLTDTEQNMRFCEHRASQFVMLSTGYHRDMMAEAFRHLKNLEDVVLRDFNSSRRSRDGPYQQWTSYGSTMAFRETGVAVVRHNQAAWAGAENFSNNVFAAIIFAIGQAGARPKGIEVMSRHRQQLGDIAFHIPSYMEASVVPVLEGLEKLHLDVDLEWRGAISSSNGLLQFSTISHPMLSKFLLRTKNLKHLRINSRDPTSDGHNALCAWLGLTSKTLGTRSDMPLTFTGSTPKFPHLEELNIGMMTVDDIRLLDLITKFAPSLKRLVLWKVMIQRPLPVGHVGAPPKINFWSKFLDKLREIPGLDLHHIKLGNVSQMWTSRMHQSIVSFSQLGSTTEYTGPDWKHFVGETISGLQVHYAHDKGNFGHDALGDEDSDEDSDDGIWDQYALEL